MTACSSPTFEVMDCVAGLNLDHRKCCWVQWKLSGCIGVGLNELSRVSRDEDGQVRQICRHNDWTRGLPSTDGQHGGRSSIKELVKMSGTSESLAERLLSTSKFTLCRFLDAWDPYPHLIEQLSRKKPTRCNVPLLLTKMLYLLTLFVLDLYAALVLTDVRFVSSASLPVLEQPPILGALVNGPAKIRAARDHRRCPLFMLPLPDGKKSF